MGTTKQRTMTRDVGPLEMRATVVPDSLNDDKRTVDLVWTTGSRVERGFFDRYLEELSLKPKHVRMERMQNGAPLLDSHNRFDTAGQIGVVERAKLTKGEGTATVRFASDEASDIVFQKVREGIVRNVSVGYRVYKLERVEEETGSLPVMRATDWEPMEISMVPVGADAGAGVRSEPETNVCEFINLPLAEETRDMGNTTPNKPASATDATPATIPAVEGANPEELRAAADKAAEAAKVEERSRIAVIQRSAKAMDLDADFVRKHIDEGTPADKFRIAAMDAFNERQESHVSAGARPSILPGEDQRDKFLRGASDWIITKAAMAATVSKSEKSRGIEHTIDPGEFRGMTLVDLARTSLEMSGVSTRGMSKMDLVGKALTHRSQQSTSDFPVLLENTLLRALLAAWETTPDTWTRFCATGSVSDFRQHHRLRMGTFSSLDVVNEGGEFTNKQIDDARKESLQALTKGNLVMLTRQAIINDDLDAFSRVMTQLGRAAKLSIEVDVYALLAQNGGLGPNMGDGNPMFDASHDNISASSVLTVAGIDGDRVVMASQRDESENDFLDLRPQAILLPVGLGGTARQVNQAQFDIDTDGGLAPNIVLGLFNDIVDTPRITGTRRYLFADPAIAPVIEVAFLDGQQEPFMESRQEWDVDGTSWKVRMDYATGGIGFRGAVTNAGA